MQQETGLFGRALALGAQTVGGASVFHNLDVVGHTVTVTLDSDTFVTPGPPLGWFVAYEGTADDASAGDVEIAPQNDVTAYVDAGSSFGPLNAAPVSVPITPPVLAIDQPAAIFGFQRGENASAEPLKMPSMRSRTTSSVRS